MKVEFEIKDAEVEQTVKDILENLPECVICLDCTSWKYTPKWEFTIVDHVDDDTDETHKLTLSMAIKAYKEVVAKWMASGRYNWTQLSDAGYWDAPMIDSLVQVAVLGEEVYG